MTCIAWDGKTIASDKRATSDGFCSTTTKLFRTKPGQIISFCGGGAQGLEMRAWIAAGAKANTFPASQRDDDNWAVVVVLDKRGLWYYERTPYPLKVEDAFYAFGSGRDYAMAAMHLGKTAREAVEIACLFDSGCGNGVTEMSL